MYVVHVHLTLSLSLSLNTTLLYNGELQRAQGKREDTWDCVS